MPNEKPTEAPEIQLPVEALQQMLSKVIEEARKPVIDQEAEARKQRARERLRAEQKRAVEEQEKREEGCTHMRPDNTSDIAWMENSDGIWRGVCQRCNALFTPVHKRYAELIRIPTRAYGIVS